MFSLAPGAAEIFAGKHIARSFDAEEHGGLVRAIGVREWVAGAHLIASPTHSTNVSNCGAGDALELAALAVATRNAPRNGLIRSALAFVATVTALDVATARGLDATTGKIVNVRPIMLGPPL